VRVYNEDVFAEHNWLRFLNLFHITTRERAIAGELTIGQGEVWDDDRVAESARRLHDPLYTSVVALVPVKSGEPGTVDLLVVTRDIWSLRLNTQYTFQQGSLTDLSFSLSENNFLGQRNVLAMGVAMDQGAIAVGPLFIDKNFLGKHLDVRVRADEIFTRRAVAMGDPQGLQDGGSLNREGSAAAITVSRSLWSLASQWGYGGSLTWRNAVARSFVGTGIRRYDDPDTPADDMLPWEYRYKVFSLSGHVTRQWGTRFKQQLNLGYTVSTQRPSLLPTFSADPMLRADFARDVFPRSELVSQPYVEYSIFTPRYRTLRNVSTYALAEDLRIGPDAKLGFAQGLRWLGGDYTFSRPSLDVGWTIPWAGDGFVRPSGSISIRLQDGETIDNTASAQLRAATPTLRWVRLVGQAVVQTRWHDTQNQFFTIGSDGGLRGYAINQFYGDRRFAGQLEARSVPVPWWVLRVGAVAFYEAGGSANSFGEMTLYQDVGIGVRTLIPQTSRELFRFDLAFPLVGAPGWPAGSPHFIAGFGSSF